MQGLRVPCRLLWALGHSAGTLLWAGLGVSTGGRCGGLVFVFG